MRTPTRIGVEYYYVHPMNDPNTSLDCRKALAAITLAGINLLAVFVFLGERRDLLNPVWPYLCLYPTAFAFYLYASNRAIALSSMLADKRILWWMVGIFAVAFRVVLVHANPSLSTDIYRYVWDGRLTCHWVNPYRWSPWDPRLAEFRDFKIWQPMEYKAYATVYMPVSQLFYAISYALFRTDLTGFKLVFTLFDCGVVGAVALLLKRLGKDPTRVIWYAWCPLPIIETSLAGHQDVIGIFLMVSALILLTSRRKMAAGFTIAAAAMTKGFALLVIPLFGRFGGRKLLISAILALFYLAMPAWVFLPEFLHGMNQYLDSVHVNSGLFSLIDWLLGFVTKNHFVVTSRFTDIVVGATAIWSISRRPGNFDEVLRRALIVITVCLLLVPTLFPWYVVWLLPFAAVFGKRPPSSIIALAASVDMVYVYYLDKAVHWWVPVIEYLPVYGLLYWEWKKGYWLRADRDDAAVELLSDSSSAALAPEAPGFAFSRGADVTQ
jgi:alpha-1,6-mannosyltransferase